MHRARFLIACVWVVIPAGVCSATRGQPNASPQAPNLFATERDDLQKIYDAMRRLSYELQLAHPPERARVPNGPSHSWRVRLLPYLGYDDLYAEYRFDEPWDSDHNTKLLNKMPTEYCNPDPGSSAFKYLPDSEMGVTNYLAIVGKGTLWPRPQLIDLEEIEDGAQNTILLVDARGMGVKWTEPRDLSLEDAASLLSNPCHPGHTSYEDHLLSVRRTHHRYLTTVLFATGKTDRFMPTQLPVEIATALFTANGEDDSEYRDAPTSASESRDLRENALLVKGIKWDRVGVGGLILSMGVIGIWRTFRHRI